MTLRLSNSSRSVFSSCKRRFFYSQNGVRIKKQRDYLIVGSIWHDYLAEGYKRLNPDFGLEILNKRIRELEMKAVEQEFSEEENKKLEKNKILLREMAKYYKPIFLEDLKGMNVIGTEVPFRISLRRNSRSKKFVEGYSFKLLPADTKERKSLYELTGVIDLLYEKEGIYYIMEHKTTSQDPMMYEQYKISSLQTITYYIAAKLILEDMGVKDPDIKMVYNITRKAYPKSPKTVQCRKCKGTGNKKGVFCDACNGTGVGGLSKVKIETTFDLVMEVLNKYPHIDRDQYVDWLEYLKNQPDTYHYRTQTFYSKDKLKDFMDELFMVYDDMRRFRNKPINAYYRTWGFICNDCPYRDLCFTGMSPEDLTDLYEINNNNGFPSEYVSRVNELNKTVKEFNDVSF